MATVALDADGLSVCRMTLSDISALKQAESLLREMLSTSQQDYKNLVNSGMALIWTSGIDKLCNYFNSVWLQFTGRSIAEEMGNGWTEGVHPDDFQRCLDIYVGAGDGVGRCEIAVSASLEGTAYSLAVADNGVGLPKDFNWKSTETLGLMLVGMLGRHQLQGKVLLDNSNGRCVGCGLN